MLCSDRFLGNLTYLLWIILIIKQLITYFVVVVDNLMSFPLGVKARGCRPTPSSRWRRTLSSPRQDTGKFTDTAHLLETHTFWGYSPWYEEHWGGVSSRDRQSFSRDSHLKSCVVTRVMHISVFPVSRVTVFHFEGDATADEGDACLIGQTVMDISRFHFRNRAWQSTLSTANDLSCWNVFVANNSVRNSKGCVSIQPQLTHGVEHGIAYVS